MSTLTQPLKWHGGKNYLAKRIIAEMPPRCKNPNNPDPLDPGWLHYVEPFFGGGSVLLAMDPEGISETVNDLNFNLMNFWNVLKDAELFVKFLRQVEATPFSSAEWEMAGSGLQVDEPTPKAVAFFIRCRQSLAGRMDSFAPLTRNRTRRGMNEQASAWLNCIEGLRAVHERLKRVVILNDHACTVIKQQDGPRSLFYCLPPGELVRTEDERLVPIESVLEGERLFGGRTVKSKLSKSFSGTVLSIKVQGLPRQIRVTSDHPILRIPGRTTGRQEKRSNDALWSAKEIVPASECRIGDYMLIPVGGFEDKPLLRIDRRPRGIRARRKKTSFVHCPELYRLIGYYAAEGHLAAETASTRGTRRYKPHSAHFSFGTHEKETWAVDAERCVSVAFGMETSGRDNDAGAFQVSIFSTTVSRALSRWVPGTAKNKRLNHILMTAPVALQKELLIGWMRGDGGLEDNDRGRVKLLGTSSSFVLAEQMFRIALRCGLRPSYKLRAGKIHDIYFAAEDTDDLGWKVSSLRSCSTRRIINGHILARIRSLSPESYSGLVYDLDVDGDDLFAAPYVIVHNCDPPYMHSTRASTGEYEHEMSDAEHAAFLGVLCGIKGRFILSGYPSKLYQTVAKKAGWRCVKIKIDNKASSAKSKKQMTECLWFNY